MTTTVFFRVLAWPLVAAIALMTLGPLEFRPNTELSGRMERFVAFAVIAAVFCLGYPKYRIHIIMLIIGLVVLLELGRNSRRAAMVGFSGTECRKYQARFVVQRLPVSLNDASHVSRKIPKETSRELRDLAGRLSGADSIPDLLQNCRAPTFVRDPSGEPSCSLFHAGC